MKLKTNEEIKKFCLAAVHCETTEKLTKLLEKNGLMDLKYWRYYDDNSANEGSINAQSPDAIKSLVEKITNSFDARLMLECMKRGINIDSPNAPKSADEALDLFFYKDKKSPFNKFKDLENETAIFSTNDTAHPCISLIDKGEGQTPDRLPDTILSLQRGNKAGASFTQGRFGQGGSGALTFCKNGMSLVLTRRCPDINNEDKHDSDNWAFSITRKVTAKEVGGKNPVYMYLAPMDEQQLDYKKNKQNKVLNFKADDLELWPERMTPYVQKINYGTLCKFYGYALPTNVGKIGQKGNIVWDFMYATEAMMPDMVLPVRLHETRANYQKKDRASSDFREQVTTMQGFNYRNSDAPALEDDFPLHESIHFKTYDLKVIIYAFKREKGKILANRRKRNDSDGIIFTQGGQHYGDIKKSFFKEKEITLNYIADDLVVIVDLTGIDGDLSSVLFQANKAIIRETDESRDLQAELKDLLANNPKLERLKNLRRHQQIEKTFEDEKPFEELLGKVIKTNPSLAKLFNLGSRLSNPWLEEDDTGKKYKPKLNYFPTFFRFKKKLKANEIYKRTGNINKKLRFDFETDAQDDYFSRKKEKGTIGVEITISNKKQSSVKVSPEEISYTKGLDKGHLILGLSVPESCKENDTLFITFSVNDDNPVTKTWTLKSEVLIEGFVKTKTRKKNENDDEETREKKKTGFDLPNNTWIDKDDPRWEENNFNESTAVKVTVAETKKIGDKEIQTWDFLLNKENKWLQLELKNNKKKLDEEVILNMYRLSLIFFSLSIIDYFRTHEIADSDALDVENSVGILTAGIAPVLLDTITSVSGLAELGLE